MVNCNADVGCRYEFSNCLFEAYTDKVTTCYFCHFPSDQKVHHHHHHHHYHHHHHHRLLQVQAECQCDTVYWATPTADNVCKVVQMSTVQVSSIIMSSLYCL